MEALNLVQVWGLASATANPNLIEMCVPLIAANLEALKTEEELLRWTEVGSLKALLLGLYSEGVTEEKKIKIIATWINAALNEQDRANRKRHFVDLLPMVELRKLRSTFMDDLAVGAVDMDLPTSCKSELVEAWRREQSCSGAVDLLLQSEISVTKYIGSFRFNLYAIESLKGG